MNFWKKLSLIATIAIAIFLGQAVINPAPAQATPYKFSFNSDRANGYFIFDDSAPKLPHPIRPDVPITQYLGSVLEYNVDFAENIVEQGAKNPAIALKDNPKTVIYLMDSEIIKLAYADEQFPDIERQLLPQDSEGWDELAFFIPGPARQSPLSMVVRFRYPEGAFSGSTAQPTEVPSKALALVFPKYDFPKTMGELGFEEEVQTSIEKLS